MQSLKKIFWHNTLHMTICTSPFLLAWVMSLLFPQDGMTKYLFLLLYIVSICLMYYPIGINFRILLDLRKKKTTDVDTIIEIDPGWKNACFGIKKKYIHEIFSKDYHNIFDIYFEEDDDYTFLEMYIKNSELQKTNFKQFFMVSYDGRNEIISKKENKIAAKITYYNKSLIIKEISFYKAPDKKPEEKKPVKTRFYTEKTDTKTKKSK